MNDHDLLLRLQELLDGVEWRPDTLEEIAALMQDSGYRIRDLDDCDVEREAPAAPRATVHVLHIEHKHGDEFWVYSSHEKAKARAVQWARDYWDQEGVPDEDGEPSVIYAEMDDDEVLGRYFDHVGYNESYVISEAALDPA